jgi:23S rRNA (uridine2552-2'-O)-methyltransferase
MAKEQGFAARSVFKLEELDRRFRLLRPGLRVLDLGAAPGSWSQYASRALGTNGVLVAVDRRAIGVALPGAVVLQADAMDLDADAFAERTAGRTPPFDVVLSDMAPDTTGVPFSDHVASIELCERALALAQRWLAPGGAFVCKVFQGEDEPLLRKKIQNNFNKLQAIRPEGTRKTSVEIFLVGTGFRA